MSSSPQICSRCVMDTTDPEITFDKDGVCSHCLGFDTVTKKNWFPNKDGAQKLETIVETIKREGKNKEYDCIIGLSGGADSSYLALKIKEFGLRPLVVHVDAGWNAELAVNNIECLVKYCDYDLHTHVMNWQDMKKLQLAYLRSGIANQDVPQDHAFFASLYHFAVKKDIRYVLNGGNLATESIFPRSWHHSAMDAANLKAIFKKFGKGKLQEYKVVSFFQYYLYYPFIRKMRVIRPLNFMPYDKETAIAELQETIGWKPYGRKHGESLFTRFFQNYYLVERFGFDKRKPHLSSLIMSEQMTREEALNELQKPLYDPDDLKEDLFYFRKKLDLTENDFDTLLKLPTRDATEFPSDIGKYQMLKKLQAKLEALSGKRLSNYS
jgi:aminotransferase